MPTVAAFEGEGTISTTRRLAAFDSRNFRRYFVGQTVSSIGSWAQQLAVTWLVLEITDDSSKLGIAVALQFLPMLVLGAPAGVLADRFDNRRLLVATSCLSGVIATTFGVVVASGHVTIWWIYVLTAMLGLVLAVERPAMQAILVQLVGPELRSSAVATNGTINSLSRLIGPAIAGALIATVGTAICFFVNGVSYLLVIAALVALRTDELVERPLSGTSKGKLREGFAYVRSHPEVARPLWVMAVVGTIAFNFGTTIPSIVRFEFGGGAGAVGTAMSVSAIGSILGGLYIAGVTPHPRRTLAYSLAGFAATFFAIAAAPAFWSFVVLSVALGFASASFQSVNSVVLQQATEPAMLGRVMALQQMAWFGSTPIGAVMMGWVIQMSSARVPFVLGGLSALGCAAAVFRRRD
jgi:MFS family permease